VLIDDLVSKGVGGEPYRMFTSRAEYRLLLREDNADQRLHEVAHGIGAIGDEEYERVRLKQSEVNKWLSRLETLVVPPNAETELLLETVRSAPLKTACSLAQILRRPEVDLVCAWRIGKLGDLPRNDVAAQIEITVKYDGYVKRQADGLRRYARMEDARIPGSLDYEAISGLSREVCEKLNAARPQSLGQASRIPGITPAALSLVAIHMKRLGAA
jgi:tRNA uridine 5-carboxymethylaminomethyl modification enzyme